MAIAAIASTTGTARGSTQGRAVRELSASSRSLYVHRLLWLQQGGHRLEGHAEVDVLSVGDAALYAAAVVGLGGDRGRSRATKRSFTSEPRLVATSKPSPYSKPLTALMLSMAAPSSACSLPNSGSPSPTGQPLMTQVMTPPMVSPSAFTSLMSCSISTAFSGSGQRTAFCSVSERS